MKWELTQSEATPQDPYGVAAFLRRLQAELTAPGAAQLSGFTFLQDSRRMLQFTRQIEKDLLDSRSSGPLYVGFQNAPKLDAEAVRYRGLRSAGVAAYGFGEGQPDSAATNGLDTWYSLAPNHVRLENQWFLVTMQPAPIVFVGWEVSDDSLWGKGGLSGPDKRFVGFVSDDPRIAQAMIAYFDDVRSLAKPLREETPGLRKALTAAQAKRLLILVDDGRRDFLRRGLQRLIESGLGPARELFLYDLSSESYLVNPYPDDEPERRKPLGSDELRALFGRAYLSALIDDLAARHITARAILPYGVGFRHLAEWSAREGIDTIVIPSEYVHPPLVERLRGYRLQLLQASFKRSVIVDDAAQGAWLVNAQLRPAAAAA